MPYFLHVVVFVILDYSAIHTYNLKAINNFTAESLLLRYKICIFFLFLKQGAICF